MCYGMSDSGNASTQQLYLYLYRRGDHQIPIPRACLRCCIFQNLCMVRVIGRARAAESAPSSSSPPVLQQQQEKTPEAALNDYLVAAEGDTSAAAEDISSGIRRGDVNAAVALPALVEYVGVPALYASSPVEAEVAETPFKEPAAGHKGTGLLQTGSKL